MGPCAAPRSRTRTSMHFRCNTVDSLALYASSSPPSISISHSPPSALHRPASPLLLSLSSPPLRWTAEDRSLRRPSPVGLWSGVHSLISSATCPRRLQHSIRLATETSTFCRLRPSPDRGYTPLAHSIYHLLLPNIDPERNRAHPFHRLAQWHHRGRNGDCPRQHCFLTTPSPPPQPHMAPTSPLPVLRPRARDRCHNA